LNVYKLFQSQIEQFANKSRQPLPNYQTSDRVWLSLKNIHTQRPSKKLNDKNALCTVVRRIGRDSYELTLPKGIGSVYPVFYTSLLRPDSNDPLPRQHVQPQGPIIIEDKNSVSYEEYEVEEILDSRYSYGFLEYKVK